MVFLARRSQSWWCVIPSLCLFVFLFSLAAKLELYGRGLREQVHPCNSSKLCLDARAPKLGATSVVVARMTIPVDHRPTLHSGPLADESPFIPIPRELILKYESRLHRSPPVS